MTGVKLGRCIYHSHSSIEDRASLIITCFGANEGLTIVSQELSLRRARGVENYQKIAKAIPLTHAQPKASKTKFSLLVPRSLSASVSAKPCELSGPKTLFVKFPSPLLFLLLLLLPSVEVYIPCKHSYRSSTTVAC